MEVTRHEWNRSKRFERNLNFIIPLIKNGVMSHEWNWFGWVIGF